MIVLDTSIFIDLLFEYDTLRTQSAEELLSVIEECGLSIVEPDLFRVELAGQVARRMKKEIAPKVCEEIFSELLFVCTSSIIDDAFSISLKTGSRAADSFYIASARVKGAVLVSNDRYQIESAKKIGIDVYSLQSDREILEKRLLDRVIR